MGTHTSPTPEISTPAAEELAAFSAADPVGWCACSAQSYGAARIISREPSRCPSSAPVVSGRCSGRLYRCQLAPVMTSAGCRHTGGIGAAAAQAARCIAAGPDVEVAWFRDTFCFTLPSCGTHHM